MKFLNQKFDYLCVCVWKTRKKVPPRNGFDNTTKCDWWNGNISVTFTTSEYICHNSWREQEITQKWKMNAKDIHKSFRFSCVTPRETMRAKRKVGCMVSNISKCWFSHTENQYIINVKPEWVFLVKQPEIDNLIFWMRVIDRRWNRWEEINGLTDTRSA
jgi:hypothetical protein